AFVASVEVPRPAALVAVVSHGSVRKPPGGCHGGRTHSRKKEAWRSREARRRGAPHRVTTRSDADDRVGTCRSSTSLNATPTGRRGGDSRPEEPGGRLRRSHLVGNASSRQAGRGARRFDVEGSAARRLRSGSRHGA